MSERPIGFQPEEVRTGESTRSARLKWVIIVDADLPIGRLANATACVAAATSTAVGGLLGPAATDATGSVHAGLPWAGCSILAADVGRLLQLRAMAIVHDDIFVADMPGSAQMTRVYDEYVDQLAGLDSDDISYAAISLVGPRKQVDRIIGGLGLLS